MNSNLYLVFLWIQLKYLINTFSLFLYSIFRLFFSSCSPFLFRGGGGVGKRLIQFYSVLHRKKLFLIFKHNSWDMKCTYKKIKVGKDDHCYLVGYFLTTILFLLTWQLRVFGYEEHSIVWLTLAKFIFSGPCFIWLTKVFLRKLK